MHIGVHPNSEIKPSLLLKISGSTKKLLQSCRHSEAVDLQRLSEYVYFNLQFAVAEEDESSVVDDSRFGFRESLAGRVTTLSTL